ncbi:MAG: hypothetical protein WBA57_04780 [Elainellaceae cyanobacterium]
MALSPGRKTVRAQSIEAYLYQTQSLADENISEMRSPRFLNTQFHNKTQIERQLMSHLDLCFT